MKYMLWVENYIVINVHPKNIYQSSIPIKLPVIIFAELEQIISLICMEI